jgi:hypothetical protein
MFQKSKIDFRMKPIFEEYRVLELRATLYYNVSEDLFYKYLGILLSDKALGIVETISFVTA